MTATPNILLMISHDLGCHIGPYGYATAESAVLGQLAAEGLRLDRHFVTSPGCSQSRSSLVTGRYPHANGQFGLAHLGWTLRRDELLLPAALSRHGYRTALVGIWHLHDWTLAAFDKVSADVSTRDSSPEGEAEIASARAAQWLRENGDSGQPFYLHVGFWETHRPFCGSEADRHAAQAAATTLTLPPFIADSQAARDEVAELHDSVSRVDRGVERILQALDDARLRENTLVVFTADHGLPFPRAKGTLYDPGIQVACLCRWPGRIAAGTSSDRLTSNVDLMPTLLEVSGAASIDRVQGESFADLVGVENGSIRPAREQVFAEKTYHEHYDPMRCVRTAEHKYVRNFAERPRLVMPSDIYNSPTRQAMNDDDAFWAHRPPEELYNLAADPGERENLAGTAEYEAVLADLRGKLDDWMAATGDPLRNGPILRPKRHGQQAGS